MFEVIQKQSVDQTSLYKELIVRSMPTSTDSAEDFKKTRSSAVAERPREAT